MLTTRQMKILETIVEEYVRTAEPVGSKTLLRFPEFAYSSATIRNEMAALEEMGYLLKTHTSSGRVPTIAGYKLYVATILKNRRKVDSFPLIDEILKKSEESKDGALKESLALISQITNYASVALGENSYNAVIKGLEIVKLTDSSAIVVMVTDQGYVESKKITIPDTLNFNDIHRVINLLNDILHDCPINAIDQRLKKSGKLDEIKKDLQYYDELIGVFARAVTEMAKDRYFVSGKTNILSYPEFRDVKKVRALIEVMDEKNIYKIVNVNRKGISVKIGRDNKLAVMQDCSVISVPYDNGLGMRGTIAVIGPTRMDYQKVIPLLDYIAKYLGRK